MSRKGHYPGGGTIIKLPGTVEGRIADSVNRRQKWIKHEEKRREQEKKEFAKKQAAFDEDLRKQEKKIENRRNKQRRRGKETI